MISSGLRDKKPYAVSIQFFPYEEVDMRRIVTQLEGMFRNGMESCQ